MAFYLDQRYCTGCMTCQIACKDKNDLPAGQNYRKVIEFSEGDYEQLANGAIVPHVQTCWLSASCNHCENPTCVDVCPTGALQKRSEDGIVLVDPAICIGCWLCLDACPYDVIVFDETTQKISKCDFCLDLLREGREPACVSSCPMRVLECGPIEALRQKYGTCNQVPGLPDPALTQPALVITPHRDALRRGQQR